MTGLIRRMTWTLLEAELAPGGWSPEGEADPGADGWMRAAAGAVAGVEEEEQEEDEDEAREDGWNEVGVMGVMGVWGWDGPRLWLRMWVARAVGWW